MVRRSRPTSKTEDAPVEATETETSNVEGQNEEAAVTATATEPEVETEATPAAESENAEPESAQPVEGESKDGEAATAEAEVDKVQELLDLAESFMDDEGRDRQTGALPEALVSKFGEMYRALDSGDKRKARTKITAAVQELLDDDSDETMFESVMKAKSYNLLINETKKGGTTAARAATAAKVDPTEAYVDQFLGLSLATMALVRPEEVDVAKANESVTNIIGAYNNPESDEHKKFAAYMAWYRNPDTEKRGDEPEVPEYVKRAFKIAEGKAAGSRRRAASSAGGTRTRVSGGAQGSIEKHVLEALAEVPVGEFKPISWIANFKSKEYEGKNPPSAGAISARLFPASGGESTIPNVEGVTADKSPEGKKGARRTA